MLFLTVANTQSKQEVSGNNQKNYGIVMVFNRYLLKLYDHFIA